MMRRTVLWLALVAASASASAGELRVCADPNNLPYSNRAGEGFENRIIELLARDLGATVRYTWWAQRRGNVRSTLDAGDCDVIPGIASGIERVGTTRPYYRSGYVFVIRDDRPLRDVTTLDDARLKDAKIGVQLVGDDGANPPPAHALARRGIIDNVRGFTVYGDYADAAPQRAIVDAVAHGTIDIAIAWGPTAGYFAAQQKLPLRLTPVAPWLDGPQWPMQFDISVGVRKDDVALRRDLDRALERHRPEIAAILQRYAVPVVPGP
jgi:mxaJ protein